MRMGSGRTAGVRHPSRHILTLIILAAIASFFPAAHGVYNETIYEGWVNQSEPFEAEGYEFRTTLIFEREDIMLRYPPAEIVVVRNGTCYHAPGEVFILCVDNFRYILDGEVVPEDIHAKDLSAQIDVRIMMTKPRIEVMREIAPLSPAIGDLIDITTTVANVGGMKANVTLIDEFGGRFMIEGFSGACGRTGTAIIQSGTLAQGQEWECQYRLRALEPGSYRSNATATYHDGIEEMRAIDAQTIAVGDFSVGLESNISNTSVGKGMPVVFQETLSASGGATLEEIRIIIPKALDLISHSDIFRVEENAARRALIHSANAAPEDYDGLTYSFTVAGRLLGNHTVTRTLSYILNGYRKNTTATTGIAVSEPMLFVTGVPDAIDTMDSVQFALRIANPGMPVKGIRPNIGTTLPLEDMNMDFSELKTNHHRTLYIRLDIEALDAAFTVPAGNASNASDAAQAPLPTVLKNITFPLNITVRYETLEGERLQVSQEHSVLVSHTPHSVKEAPPPVDLDAPSAEEGEGQSEESTQLLTLIIVIVGLVVMIGAGMLFTGLHFRTRD
ncbi:hypothetical protein JXB02_00965 [Candidatus Woesearchaeota archaeon]|nr:hypothetical protein [Candidatus Woesearchaeota archaeon]